MLLQFSTPEPCNKLCAAKRLVHWLPNESAGSLSLTPLLTVDTREALPHGAVCNLQKTGEPTVTRSQSDMYSSNVQINWCEMVHHSLWYKSHPSIWPSVSQIKCSIVSCSNNTTCKMACYINDQICSIEELAWPGVSMPYRKILRKKILQFRSKLKTLRLKFCDFVEKLGLFRLGENILRSKNFTNLAKSRKPQT